MKEDNKSLFSSECSLTALRTGQKAMISAIKGCPSSLLQKLVSMGVVNGTEVTVTQRGLFGSPINIDVLGSVLSLRRAEAAYIHVQAL
jgi:Fe2+ transport system protein FeoA